MMSSSHRPPSSTIFIGNIPYDVTEQMLVDIFQEVGPVKSLRLVSDRDTGKPKGYGFCEYYEVQVAESAMHNLNGREVNGRSLRVDYADEHQAARERRVDRVAEPQPRGSQYPPPPPQAPGSKIVGPQAAQVASQQMDMLLGGPGASQEKVSAIIAGMTPRQLYDLMAQFKLLLHSNHQGTREFLISKPQVVKALFQAQIVLGMVKAPPPPQPAPSPPPQPAPAASQAPIAASQQQPPLQQQPPPPMYPSQQPLAPGMAPQQPPHIMVPLSQPQAFPQGGPGYAPMGMAPMGNMPPGMAPPGMMPPGAGPPGYMDPQQVTYQPQPGPQGGPPMQQMPGMPPQAMMAFPPGMQMAPQPGGPVPMQPNQGPPMMMAPQQPQQQPPPPPQQQPMMPQQQMQPMPQMQPMRPMVPMQMAPQPAPQEQPPPMQQQQQQQQAAAPAAQPANLDPAQQALLMQVMQMSEAQLAALPEPTRTQVLQLKERAKGLFPQGAPVSA